MKSVLKFGIALALAASGPAVALSLAPEEFTASRQMACVMAQQSLGQLTEQEYGERANTVLDGFDGAERDNIIAKALGYYDGLMFAIPEDDQQGLDLRLESFVSSSTCSGSFRAVTVSL